MSRAAEYLMTQYNSKKLRNPRFSMRAFAQQIGINSGRLSQFFSGERTISKSMADKISTKLNLDDAEKTYFQHLVTTDEKSRKSMQLRVLRDDEIAALVEWHHYALMALTMTSDFRLDTAWIAERLALDESLVISSLERLQRLGLLKIEGNAVVKPTAPVATTTDIPSQFLRLAHTDKMRYMIDRMDVVPVERRDVSAITFAIDEKKLPQIKTALRNFRRKLAGKYSRGKTNQVYTMTMEFFPMTQPRKRK